MGWLEGTEGYRLRVNGRGVGKRGKSPRSDTITLGGIPAQKGDTRRSNTLEGNLASGEKMGKTAEKKNGSMGTNGKPLQRSMGSGSNVGVSKLENGKKKYK